MINHVYQLIRPEIFSVKYDDFVNNQQNTVIVRPKYMSICHADQRYYLGKRDSKTLKKKLPMALIHEACGEIIFDNTGKYQTKQKVVMIPNIPCQNPTKNVLENYDKKSHFLSSGYDGFMQELVCLPVDRVVPLAEDIPLQTACITEFISVAVHAINRLLNLNKKPFKTVGIWGDGNLAYTLACVLCEVQPELKIFVIGRNSGKLSQFSFINGTYLSDEIPKDFEIDCAFECAGGEGSCNAINSIIKCINPQGTAVLMGVSENNIPINTRMILEKGLMLVGSSRSGRTEFLKSAEILINKRFSNRLKNIIYEGGEVENIKDIHEVFKTDLKNSFKTIFKWNV